MIHLNCVYYCSTQVSVLGECGDLVGIYNMHNFISTLPSTTDRLCTTTLPDEHQQVLTTGAPTISSCSKDYMMNVLIHQCICVVQQLSFDRRFSNTFWKCT